MLPEVPARGGCWDATPAVLRPSVLVPSGTVRGQREVGGVNNAAVWLLLQDLSRYMWALAGLRGRGSRVLEEGDGSGFSIWFLGSVSRAAAGIRSRPSSEALPLR